MTWRMLKLGWSWLALVSWAGPVSGIDTPVTWKKILSGQQQSWRGTNTTKLELAQITQ